jgi:hypothetical protein
MLISIPRNILLGRLLFVLFCCLANMAGAQISTDFALLDQTGKFHQLSRYNESSAVVLLVHVSGDPVSGQILPLLGDLRERYQDEDVVFFLLNPDPEASRELVARELGELGLEIAVLLDSAQLLARSLAVETTGEAFILDPESYAVIYRGPLDSRAAVEGADPDTPVPYLESALRALLARGDTGDPGFEVPPVNGTPIQYIHIERFAERQISYQDEIVPIVQRRCTACHVDEGLAPWAMISHRMMQGWSPMMREVLITRRMPPGQIDMQIGEWGDIHHITDDELITLVHWIDTGARREGDGDPLAEQPPTVDSAWRLGEPDLLVDVPEELIPATGLVDFKIKRADINLANDQWVQAVAYTPGDRAVLHSLLVYAVDPDISARDTAALIDPDNAEFISLFVPGRSEDVFAADAGFLLRADRDLSFKLRYVTGGRETIDRTQIGFYFRDTLPVYSVRHVMTLNEDFQLAPGLSNQLETANSEPFVSDVYVESFAPQTHTRGKSMTISAHYPDGSETLLLNVANYNFNWQMNYPLRERLFLPAGSSLFSETVYDNSAANPHNIDPEAEVRSGITTWDETFSHYVRVLEPVTP